MKPEQMKAILLSQSDQIIAESNSMMDKLGPDGVALLGLSVEASESFDEFCSAIKQDARSSWVILRELAFSYLVIKYRSNVEAEDFN